MRRVALVATIVLIIVVAILLGLTLYKRGYVGVSEAPKEITVTDALGRNVTLRYPVKTVIVTDDEVAELVQLLGAADRVVGIEPSIRERGYFPQMKDKPITGSQFRGLNYELVAQLKPDVVIMMDVGPITKVIDKLDKIGVKSIVISIKPKNIPQTIKLLGKIFGKEKRAKKLLEWWNEKWEFLRERMSSVTSTVKLKVFVGMGFTQTDRLPTRTWGKLAKWNYILNVLNLENIAAKKLETHGELDLEYIAKESPDIIIVGDWSDNWTGYTKNSTELADKMIAIVMKDPVLQDVSAIKNGKVFIVHYVLLGSFRSVIGAYYLAKVAYPEVLKDVNPDQIHKEYFETWLEVPYKGIWFYPCPWLSEG